MFFCKYGLCKQKQTEALQLSGNREQVPLAVLPFWF